MFDLSPTLVRAPVENDSAARKARARQADPFGLGRTVLLERSRSLDERPQWVALIDNEGNLKRLILRLTASAARKLLADEDVRFRETVFVRSRRGQRHHDAQHDLFGWIQGRSYVVGQVYSIVMILRALGDDPMSGQRRLNLTNEVDELLRRVFDTLVVEHGEEFAVMQLWGIVKKAPSYVHAPWLTELWTEYREELMEEVSGRESRSVYPDWDTP